MHVRSETEEDVYGPGQAMSGVKSRGEIDLDGGAMLPASPGVSLHNSDRSTLSEAIPR